MFRNAVTLFRIAGIELKIDPSWVLIAALILWSLTTQYFPSVIPLAGLTAHFVLALLGMLGLFASLTLHELAHSMVARHYGLKIEGITLFVFGGVAELGSEPETPGQEFWIAVAGPAASFAIAGILSLVAPLGLGAGGAALFGYLIFVNTMLGLFNLIPAYPMDGGRVLRALLWHRSGSMDRATMLAARTGIFLGVVLIGLGVLSMLGGGGIGGLWTILIGFFIFSAARGNHGAARYRLTLLGTKVGDLMSRMPVSVPPEMPVATLIEEVMIPRRASLVPVVRDGVPVGCVDADTLRQVRPEDRAATRVGDVMRRISEVETLAPETPAQIALERILVTGQRKFLVMDRGAVVGVLSLTDLRSFLALKEELAA